MVIIKVVMKGVLNLPDDEDDGCGGDSDDDNFILVS